MARRLILLRHAKSSWDDSSQRDFDRPLNKRGLRDAPRMGRLLRDAGIKPAVIISSDAKRALTTAKLIATELGHPVDDIRPNHALYLAPPTTLLEALATMATHDNDVLMVAHNPGMTDLANQLSDARIDNLPTCGVVIITQDAEDWHELGNNAGCFEGFYSPKKDLT